MPKPLPSKLGNEPLVEAICELYVKPADGVSLHSVLPGYLYAKFPHEVTSFEQLPASGLPDILRQQEPAFANAPLIRLVWRRYFILIGSRQIALACRLPYPGWTSFKDDILLLFGMLLGSDLAHGIERYSMKYVNFFPSTGEVGNTSMMDWKVRVGEFSLRSEAVQLRLEVPKDEFLTVVTVVSPASVKREGGLEQSGGVIDVDTICTVSIPDVAEFCTQLPDRLQKIRLANKQEFFDCLTPSAIQGLKPEYDHIS